MRNKRKWLAQVLSILMIIGCVLSNPINSLAQDIELLKAARLRRVFEDQIVIM